MLIVLTLYLVVFVWCYLGLYYVNIKLVSFPYVRSVVGGADVTAVSESSTSGYETTVLISSSFSASRKVELLDGNLGDGNFNSSQ
jgi:hypothetical protein